MFTNKISLTKSLETSYPFFFTDAKQKVCDGKVSKFEMKLGVKLGTDEDIELSKKTKLSTK